MMSCPGPFCIGHTVPVTLRIGSSRIDFSSSLSCHNITDCNDVTDIHLTVPIHIS